MGERTGKLTVVWWVGWIVFIAVISVVFIKPLLEMSFASTKKVVCGANAKCIGVGLNAYAHSAKDKFPLETWCDDLVMEGIVELKNLVCPESGCFIGESCYALNYEVARWGNLRQADRVLLFETSAGRVGQREYLVGGRNCQKNSDGVELGEVHKDMWNQVGGPELLTLEYHNGEGANILFGDGHVEFVPAEKLCELKWSRGGATGLTKADVERLVQEAQAANQAEDESIFNLEDD